MCNPLNTLYTITEKIASCLSSPPTPLFFLLLSSFQCLSATSFRLSFVSAFIYASPPYLLSHLHHPPFICSFSFFRSLPRCCVFFVFILINILCVDYLWHCHKNKPALHCIHLCTAYL